MAAATAWLRLLCSVDFILPSKKSRKPGIKGAEMGWESHWCKMGRVFSMALGSVELPPLIKRCLLFSACKTRCLGVTEEAKPHFWLSRWFSLDRGDLTNTKHGGMGWIAAQGLVQLCLHCTALETAAYGHFVPLHVHTHTQIDWGTPSEMMEETQLVRWLCLKSSFSYKQPGFLLLLRKFFGGEQSSLYEASLPSSVLRVCMLDVSISLQSAPSLYSTELSWV